MRPTRLPTFAYTGFYAYSLTVCTLRRQRHFGDARAVRCVLDEFLRAADGCDFQILAHCFMPDHAHLLVVGCTPAAHLQRFVKLARQRSAVLFKRDTAERLWQPGYLERILRADEDVAVVARYFQANPVRAGLASSVDEWPFTGGRLLEGPN